MASASSNSLPSVKLILIGQTGTGKSAFGNLLCSFQKPNSENSIVFQEGGGAESHTRDCSETVKEWGGTRYEIIDTPGLMDSAGSGQDVTNIRNIVDYLRRKNLVNLFVLLFNEQYPRFDQAMQIAFKTFYDSFGGKMIKNTIFVFTRSKDYLKEDASQLIGKRSDDFYNVAARMVEESGLGTRIPGYGVNCHPENDYDTGNSDPRRAEFAKEDLAKAIEANNISMRRLLTYACCVVPLSCSGFEAKPPPEPEIQLHHPGYFDTSSKFWACCKQGIMSPGCQKGDPYHHPGAYRSKTGKITQQAAGVTLAAGSVLFGLGVGVGPGLAAACAATSGWVCCKKNERRIPGCVAGIQPKPTQ